MVSRQFRHVSLMDLKTYGSKSTRWYSLFAFLFGFTAHKSFDDLERFTDFRQRNLCGTNFACIFQKFQESAFLRMPQLSALKVETAKPK